MGPIIGPDTAASCTNTLTTHKQQQSEMGKPKRRTAEVRARRRKLTCHRNLSNITEMVMNEPDVWPPLPVSSQFASGCALTKARIVVFEQTRLHCDHHRRIFPWLLLLVDKSHGHGTCHTAARSTNEQHHVSSCSTVKRCVRHHCGLRRH